MDIKRIRPLDAAIVIAVILVLGLGAYLGYAMWQNQRQLQESSVVGRGLDRLVAEVRRSPDDLGLRMRLAQAYAVIGESNEAIKQYELILGANDEYGPAYAGLGMIALQEEEWSSAEGYFTRALEIFNANRGAANLSAIEQAHFYLGTALLEQKKYEDAASNFKAALRLRRDSSTTHYLLAVSLRELGLDEAYRESLGNTLMFDPEHPEANYDMGQLLLEDGDVAGAAEHFRRSVDSAPGIDKPAEALSALGTSSEHLVAAKRLQRTDADEALAEARVARALDPNSLEATLLVGRLYEDAGTTDKAREAYERALTIDGDNAEAKAGLERVSDGS